MKVQCPHDYCPNAQDSIPIEVSPSIEELIAELEYLKPCKICRDKGLEACYYCVFYRLQNNFKESKNEKH